MSGTAGAFGSSRRLGTVPVAAEPPEPGENLFPDPDVEVEGNYNIADLPVTFTNPGLLIDDLEEAGGLILLDGAAAVAMDNLTADTAHSVTLTVTDYTAGGSEFLGILKDGAPVAFSITGNGDFTETITTGSSDATGFQFLGSQFKLSGISVVLA